MTRVGANLPLSCCPGGQEKKSLSPGLLAAADRGIDLKIVSAQSESSPKGEGTRFWAPVPLREPSLG